MKNRQSILRHSATSLTIAFLLILLNTNVWCQSAGITPMNMTPGSPVGSYPLSDLDNINLFNGNLSFHLPLLNKDGRGATSISAMLEIEQMWRVEKFFDFYGTEYNYPNYTWWTGLRPGYGPGVLQGRIATFEPQECLYYGSFPPAYGITRLTFTAPDGTEYNLHDQLTGGQPTYALPCVLQGASRGTIFVSADGSAMTFVSDTTIYQSHNIGAELFSVSGFLIMRDGTSYRIDNGLVTWSRDRNGNKVNYQYDSQNRVTMITDSLNRQVDIEYDVTDNAPYGLCDRIIFYGQNHTTRTIRVSKTNLGNTLSPGFTLQTYHQLFPELNDPCSSICNGIVNPIVVSTVWLPDNRPYKFYYNSYIELTRVELPTGGAIEYDHAAGIANGSSSGFFGGSFQGYFIIYRRTTERRVYLANNVLTEKTTYTRPESVSSNGGIQTAGYVGVDHLSAPPNVSLLLREKHYFYGHPFSSNPGHNGYVAWKDSKEYKTELLDSDALTVLRRTTATWQQRVPVTWWSSWQYGYGQEEPANDPRIVETVTTLVDSNQVAKQTAINPNDGTIGFDQFNNQTDLWEYDYGTGVPGSLIKRTHTDFLTINPVNNVNYASDLNVHLRSLPKQTSTYDANNIEVERTTIEYDNYANDANHASLVNRANISGFDATFGTNYPTRGNATKRTQWLLPSTEYSMYLQYDVAGNVVKSIDPKGAPSYIYYDDNFGTPDAEAHTNSAPQELASIGKFSYAFPTRVSNALGHNGYTQYDYYIAQPVDSEDTNGVVTSSYYNDPLDRLKQTIRAANQGASVKSQVSIDYDDVNHLVTTTRDLNSYDDNILKSQTVYDGLGRTTENRAYETSTTYIRTKTIFDGLGRTSQVSNPYRTGENVVWTTSAYDTLGRIKTVTAPDGAVVTTNYLGNVITVTDQNGKQRKSVRDALGRLVQMYEDPQGLNYLTGYSYDALGNLRWVQQGTQNRYFQYDSLSRLMYARSPEEATPYTTIADPLANNNTAWSVRYVYDENNNMTQFQDARGVISTYTYDALNRNTITTYSNGTPSVTRYYDGPGITNSLGRLWKEETSGTSLTQFSGFDALGRPLSQGQQFYYNNAWSVPYTVTPTYNLTGSMIAETYPSGHTVNYSYDGAGRLSIFGGNLGDGVTRTYSTGMTYSSLGGMTQEQFGTNTPIYNKALYNSRGQLSEIRVSTTANDTNWNRGAIINQYSFQCWGMGCNGTDNNGNIKKQEVYIPTQVNEGTGAIESYTAWHQQYDYDSLNRLLRVHEYTSDPNKDWQQEYINDRWGNRLIHQTNTWGTDIPKPNFGINTATNQLTPTGSATISYDAAGNQTYDNYTGGGTRSYDAGNRMTEAWFRSPGVKGAYLLGKYAYDGDGRRISRKVGNVETWQIYGVSGELLCEYAANSAPSSPQKEYGYQGGQLLVTAEPNSNDDNIQWLIADHLGSPRMIVDRTGSLSGIKRKDHLPFGEELASSNGVRSTLLGYVVDNVRQGFTSYEKDNETGLDYAQARYYASPQGRFISVDSAPGNTADPQTFNRYSYVANNPTNATDPDGRYPRNQHQFITFLMAAMIGFDQTSARQIGQGSGDSDNFRNAATGLLGFGAFINLNGHFGRPKSPSELLAVAQNKGLYALGRSIHLVEDNAPGGPHQITCPNNPNGCYGLWNSIKNELAHIRRGHGVDTSGNLNGFEAAWNDLSYVFTGITGQNRGAAFPKEVIGSIVNFVNRYGLDITGIEYIGGAGGGYAQFGTPLSPTARLVSSQVVGGVTVNIYVDGPLPKRLQSDLDLKKIDWTKDKQTRPW